MRPANLALSCALWVAACLPEPWVPPVTVCTGPRCPPTDGGAADARSDAPPDVAADAPPASCRGQNLRGLASGIGEFGCAIRCEGSVWCWGANRYGSLGDGTTTSRATPAPVHDLGGPATSLAVGFHHACAVVGGAARCWGHNGDGQVGGGAGPDQPRPRTVTGLGRPVVSLAVGGTHTCALLDDGSVWCWGGNRNGQLGDGTNVARLAPGAVRQLGGAAAALVAGQYHSCARMVDGEVRCWGSNALGPLGDGSTTRRLTPTAVQGLDGTAALLSAGDFHTCAALTDGRARCWGAGSTGELGTGAFDDSPVPATVLLPP